MTGLDETDAPLEGEDSENDPGALHPETVNDRLPVLFDSLDSAMARNPSASEMMYQVPHVRLDGRVRETVPDTACPPPSVVMLTLGER